VSIVVEVIEEGVLSDISVEEGVPLEVDAGVKRELYGDVSLDGVQADDLGVQQGRRKRPQA
jgi:hypothetical protein